MNSNISIGKGISLLALIITIAFSLIGCSTGQDEDTDTAPQEQAEQTMDNDLILKINDEQVDVTWEDNESVDALKELAKEGPLTIQMSMYGGNEQVGSIGTTLPSNDKRTTTEPGDIVLYNSENIVIFYGSNSWAYTRLGKINETSEEMTELLSNGDVRLIIKK